jgi:hypothetical protein
MSPSLRSRLHVVIAKRQQQSSALYPPTAPVRLLLKLHRDDPNTAGFTVIKHMCTRHFIYLLSIQINPQCQPISIPHSETKALKDQAIFDNIHTQPRSEPRYFPQNQELPLHLAMCVHQLLAI